MNPDSTISWDESLIALNSILPGTKTFALNQICDIAQQKGLGIQWSPIPDWENLDDTKTLDVILGSDSVRGADNAIMLPAICFYGDCLPFRISHDGLKNFVGGFLSHYGQCFFNGDTLILFPSRRIIYLFHHEGMYTKIVA